MIDVSTEHATSYPVETTTQVRTDLEHLNSIAHALHPNSKDDVLTFLSELSYGKNDCGYTVLAKTKEEIISIAALTYVENRAVDQVQSSESTTHDVGKFFVDKLKKVGKVPAFKARGIILQALASSDDEYVTDVFNQLVDEQEAHTQKVRRVTLGLGFVAIAGLLFWNKKRK